MDGTFTDIENGRGQEVKERGGVASEAGSQGQTSALSATGG